MDITTIIGIIAGIAALLGGFLWEGGQAGGLLQGPAALIVFGGTAAAVAISFPWRRLRTVPQALRLAFGTRPAGAEELIEDLAGMASTARRSGMLALEKTAENHEDPFMREGLTLIVDGGDPPLIRKILELEIDKRQEKFDSYAKIFESAGGYAPTMGIIGTVMGLIRVLGSLTEPANLGSSIAVAFIATLYGVASANLIFLPIASKIRARGEEEVQVMEMMLEGLLSVQNAENPNLVRRKLATYLDDVETGAPVGTDGAESR
ncbi:flagellar motor protein [Saccharibacillus sp. CPCC 101409]|uniref:flagellar motor protein n=1 Tax=Saccharibacillus sp. CPCC 101409 TaxID=3058041 RepID=UPI002672DCB5|nr:flagellar motor protein [Saccharibacillus sp. CPCC 101409]MDO3412035.1 flagellar motor protein [Saccharibacillus sp. CPCC 101409]